MAPGLAFYFLLLYLWSNEKQKNINFNDSRFNRKQGWIKKTIESHDLIVSETFFVILFSIKLFALLLSLIITAKSEISFKRQEQILKMM